MRLTCLRFTIRRMMILVAIAAILSGVAKLWQRSRIFAAVAVNHHWEYSRLIEIGFDHAIGEAKQRDLAYMRGESTRVSHEMKAAEEGRIAKAIDREAAYHGAMAEKYARAARYPWLPVEPDLPEPK